MKKISKIQIFFIILSLFLFLSQVVLSALNSNLNEFRLSVNSIQSVYQRTVPHTDRMGKKLLEFDREKSFFPICIYHAMVGNQYGYEYSFEDLKPAGFNCIHTWEGQTIDSVIENIRRYDLQLIYHGTRYRGPNNQEVEKYAKDPNILGWYLLEEPTSKLWDKNMEAEFAAFQKRMKEIKEIDNIHPIFVIDSPAIKPPRTSWWIKWNTAGDISSHDNYWLLPGRKSLSGASGILETVSLAVESNSQNKPVLFVAQAFGRANPKKKYWYMPNGRDVRAMVYTSIIHGSTGIIYFAFDSWVTRNAHIVGITADPATDYPGRREQRLVASEEQILQAKKLWEDVVTLNAELNILKPTILSPTSPQKYEVYVQGESYTDSPIRCMLKEINGEFTLLTVNLDKRPLRVKYLFPRNIVNLQTSFEEGRNVEEMTDKFWIDTYEEFGVHIYKFRLQ